MKLLASALSLLAVVSCSNDADVLSQQDTPKTKQVAISLSMEKDANEALRAVYGVDESNELGVISGLEMPEKDVVLRIGVRRGTGYVLMQDITFTKTQGRNHAWYKGKITVPTDGSGDYQIVALLKEEVNGTKFLTPSSTTDFTSSPVSSLSENTAMARTMNNPASFGMSNVMTTAVVTSGKVTANVPYTSKWQPLQVTGDAANTTILKLEPQGTLLRMRIHNTSDATQTFQRIKLVSNAFYLQATFYLNWERNGYPGIVPEPYETQTLLIPDGITVEAGKYSKWFYHWVMPRVSAKADLYTVASISPATTPTLADYSQAFSTSSALPHGSVPVTLTYDGKHQAQIESLTEYGDQWGATTATPPSPLEYFAPNVLNQSGTGFVTTQDPTDTSVGFFQQSQLKNLLQAPIDNVQWRIPTRDEMAGLLPVEFDKMGYGSDKFLIGNTTYNVLEESIKLGEVTQSYYADYYSNGTVLYGVRFKNGSNKYRTAFRYMPITDPQTGGRIYTISTYYLGNEAKELTDITNADFWTNNQDKVTTRSYTLYGVKMVSGASANIGSAHDLATSTAYDTGASYIGFINTSRSRVMTRNVEWKRVVLPIRSL